MVATTIRPHERPLQDSTSPTEPGKFYTWLQKGRWVTWLLLVAALLLFMYFAYQVVLVPKQRDYHANWHGARWINVANSDDSVGYFRKDIALENNPDNAFLTIQADQYYTVYVNSIFLDDTTPDFKSGVVYDTNVYDVASLLHPGLNTIAIRVVNQDQGPPHLRAVLGVNYGAFLQVFPSDITWRATSDPSLTQPYLSPTSPAWQSQLFSDASWPASATYIGAPLLDGLTPFDPITFETPMPTNWLTAGPVPAAYYYDGISLSAARTAWLRVASTGTATLFINGEQAIQQPARLTLDQTGTSPPGIVSLTAGVYDITPYVHEGVNQFAAHISSSGLNQDTLKNTQPAALAFDLIIIGDDGAVTHVIADRTWRVSPTAGAGWPSGVGTGQWPAATLVDRSVVSDQPPYKIANIAVRAAADEVGTPFAAPQLTQVSAKDAAVVLTITLGLFLLYCALGLLAQRVVLRRNVSLPAGLDRIALALAPVVGVMALLLVLSHYSLIPRPFPYTRPWLDTLIMITLATFGLILVALRRQARRRAVAQPEASTAPQMARRKRRWRTADIAVIAAVSTMALLGLYMVTYNLGYESFWQDELASINAATGVVQHGIPVWSTGFVYTKSELFSYMLAPFIAIFGYNPVALRMLPAIEYVVTLLLTYFIGRYFFGKRAGLIAMALALTSPVMLHWGREARMYQQAQMMMLVVTYLFHRAVQPEARKRYIYLSMAAVVAMYLSHEETFIVLPALLIYFLWTQRLTWIRNRHWWIAGLSAIACIAAQLLAWRLTRRPILGTDRTVLFLLHYSPENVNYYLQVIFNPANVGVAVLDSFLLVTVVMIVAAFYGIIRRDSKLRYLSIMTFVPLAILAISLPIVSDRYIYLLLPLMFLLDAAILVRFIDKVGQRASRRLPPLAARGITVTMGVLLCVTLFASQISSLNNFGLAVSRTLGLQYHHFHPDYQTAGDYVRAHWQPGDVLIAGAPESDTSFYAQAPQYELYQSKALSLFERNGAIATNSTGATPIFNVGDFNQILAKYHRVWLIQGGGHGCCVGNEGGDPIYENFTLVFEGQTTAVYFRSS